MGFRSAERERRNVGRNRRRVAVRFGTETARHLGYTTDLGAKGLFVHCNQLFPTDTRLRLEVDLPEGPRIFRGVVRWVKEVPPAFRRLSRGGMGIELLDQE